MDQNDGVITVTRDVDAPGQAVWDVLADGWSYATWVVGASRVRDVDEGFAVSERGHCRVEVVGDGLLEQRDVGLTGGVRQRCHVVHPTALAVIPQPRGDVGAPGNPVSPPTARQVASPPT